ncbi:Protein transport protein SEC20 [Nakaseomyces bracarensis]|uniref:Protein transport protein SEC20 n=1 Tax=Nakaseomyces bracarensis TaxID=273131 RepID=A0ABR4NLT6_9SACH
MELKRLQRQLIEAVDEGRYEEALSEGVSEYRGLLAEFEVEINSECSDGSLVWVSSGDANVHDSVTVRGLVRPELVAEFVAASDWLYEFRRDTVGKVLSRHARRAVVEDELRDQEIERHIGAPTLPTEQASSLGDERDAGLAGKDKLLNKTKRLTQGLSRGTQLLQSGILQSDLNLDELKQQTRSLQQVDDKYEQFESIFTRTNQLVKTLEKASNQEKRDVYLSLGFLCFAIGWVIWRRILIIPCKLALWVLFRFFKTILMTVGFVSRQLPSSNTTAIASVNTIATAIANNSFTESVGIAVSEAVDRIAAMDDEL